jgi:hypothetical protein
MSFDLRHCVSRLVRLRAHEQQRGTALQRFSTRQERQQSRAAVDYGISDEAAVWLCKWR